MASSRMKLVGFTVLTWLIIQVADLALGKGGIGIIVGAPIAFVIGRFVFKRQAPPAPTRMQRPPSYGESCPSCGVVNPAGLSSCRSCGAVLRQPSPAPVAAPAQRFCGQCGAQIKLGQSFCGSCGAPAQR